MNDESPKADQKSSASKSHSRTATFVITSALMSLFVGFLIPIALYLQSDFFGWSAPRGGEAAVAVALVALAVLSTGLLIYLPRVTKRIRRVVSASVLSFWVGLLLGLIAPVLQSPPYWAWGEPKQASELLVTPRVAHAGGSIFGETYTNSLEALERNKDRFSLFEIDLMALDDGNVVCLHDKANSAVGLLGKRISGSYSLADFLVDRNFREDVTPCTFDELVFWLETNPTKRVVTDAKTDNVFLLNFIAANQAGDLDRFIPQIYSFDEYDIARNLGFSDVIFTTYKSRYSPEEIFAFAQQTALFAVTITSTEVPILAPELSRVGTPTYVHTVNDLFWFRELRKWGASNIYTDHLKATQDGY